MIENTEADYSDIDDNLSLTSFQTDDLSEAHFQMPYEIVGGSIQNTFKEKMRVLRHLLKTSSRKLEKHSAKGMS